MGRDNRARILSSNQALWLKKQAVIPLGLTQMKTRKIIGLIFIAIFALFLAAGIWAFVRGDSFWERQFYPWAFIWNCFPVPWSRLFDCWINHGNQKLGSSLLILTISCLRIASTYRHSLGLIR